jgi:hypothetical protein
MDNVAVVQATVTEKRTDKGQDTSGHGSWMDVFEKRGDKWVMVRSHSSWVKNAIRERGYEKVERAVPSGLPWAQAIGSPRRADPP